MAWRCTGKTNAELIANMRRADIIGSDRVAEAMSKVDRANYVPHPSTAYEDSPQPIGHGATISAPHMHAYASTHLLHAYIGSGSGYLTAVFHHLIGPQGIVLAQWSEANLRKDGLGGALERGEIKVVVGDGREGLKRMVCAAAPTVPQPLIDQLASPGRMFIPVGTGLQYVEHVDKNEKGEVTRDRVMGVSYVPLTDRTKQTGRMN
ncbi:protein-L-isoaspartate O-methyltransferase [Cyathus striatus]|nr:protein-L-isoaspartate O-methyltransferase [Cyathus striatus]